MATFGWKLGTNDNSSAQSTQSNQTVTGDPPPANYHWQGGAANSNGTQDSSGHQTGGREVDANYNYDANGNQLTPEQQAYWREYDRQRAYNASVAASWAAARGNSSNNPSLSGIDYDPGTKTWQYYDTKAKKWTAGNSIEDIYNNLFTDQQREAHPLFYYQNQADTSDYEQLRHELYNYQNQQGLAAQGTPMVRYQPVNF